ncbi:ABC transporter ATP-binding protein [Pseudooctadecabacter jejudonensis]|uniref:Polysialic acid transport ATP-binding protein KpsT n=1 Tax=Pseudooctadecabacter jejudonensis TaxID=1391910 RepID=A0A1Y5TH07_9RHOB|nr:ABC transporter ATP-binding protein [Pseudooctadecabacter jejudonensis]SLN61813.1 Polysialic acid transport ATP-binding protein KpsT [Pseudooctadecabacter jejudonensis]
MIEFHNVTKQFVTNGKIKTVISDLNLSLPGRRSLGLLGRNGAGKSTLLNMIAGTSEPTYGQIVTEGLVSWPVGFAGSFHPDLTGLQNCRFISRIYGVDTDGLVEFVEDFAGLKEHFRMPLRSYSSGMKSRLAFAVSMGIEFDIYLVDEITAVGDAAFRESSDRLFQARTQSSSAVVCSHSMDQVKRLCDCALVLGDDGAQFFESVDEAIQVHKHNMAQLVR